jgi:hypothetical protein
VTSSACRSVPSRPRPHAIALALLIGAGVLVMDPAGWSPYGPAKWLAVVVVALSGLALALARGSRYQGGRWVFLTRRVLVAWTFFLVWVVVSAAAGLDPRLAWLGTPQRHFGALTWLLCGAMWDGLQWSSASLAALSGGTVASANVVVGADQVVVTVSRPPTGQAPSADQTQVQVVGTPAG